MMNRSGIETYELLRLDEVALAGYFDLEDTRFEEWYEKNRAVGDRLYSAILDRKIDLVAFRGTEDGRYYSILTRSPKQEGSLQLTDIDSKGPIGHRRLTNQKMLDLPGTVPSSPPFPTSRNAMNGTSCRRSDSHRRAIKA